jgi:hypothetical protein
MLLDTTTRKLQVLADATATTTESPVVATYADLTTTTTTPAATNTITNGTTAVDVVAAPAASTQRQILFLSIYNADTVSRIFTVRYNDNGTLRIIIKVTLDAGQAVIYTSHGGWQIPGSTSFVSPLSVPLGGTGRVSATAYGPIFGGTTSTGAEQSAAAGTAGQVLKSGGAAAVGAYADDVAAVGVTIDGAGVAITTGVKGYITVPFSGTIVQATLVGDVTGSIVIDVWKLAFSTSALPTVANTITASAKPTLSSAKGSQDSTLTGWTTSVSAGDTFGFNVDSCTTTTKATLVLKIKKS